MNLMGKGPLGQKNEQPPEPIKTPRWMRKVAKGSRSSSDCPVMKSAKGEPCLADWCGCGGSTETTAMRHIRKFGAGGAGMKPAPFIAFYGCQVAENLWENNKDQPWGWDGVMQAMVLTQLKLIRKGLLGITTPPNDTKEPTP